ncbi:S8 family peptidase [Sinorhizobium medicae]|uniref:S8 family peptidase n=1 Tax=Sinorhizobium medicae TaxID=110321 RepID=UPI0004277A10|nr:S8 family serine peptidase [Sinorhizobium medicae]MDX0451746.1 S8 family serine peptidase [Sinorhizobium medicae]MDX1060552.1 S8 family serine peptidase [Sinorhizobium medicae]
MIVRLIFFWATFVLFSVPAALAQNEVLPEGIDSARIREVTQAPSAETLAALSALQRRTGGLPPTGGPGGVTTDYNAGALIVKRDALPAERQTLYVARENGNAAVPFVVPSSMLLQLDPKIGEGLGDLLQKTGLVPTRAFPNLSSLRVRADLTRFFTPQPTDDSNNDAVIRGLLKAAEYYRGLDARIIAATPELLLRDQSQENMVQPSDVTSTENSGAEQVDWGIVDIEADQLWDMPGAKDGVILGVMDAGFARHEDLVFLRPPTGLNASDHGNHVAGIICARHGNAGMKGVLPNCFVRPQTADRLKIAADGGDVLQFVIAFGDVLTAFDRLLGEESSVHAFNISLGYNWIPNFAINPDGSTSAQWRDLVRLQGPFVLSVLARAERTKQVIFSAAGNDSSATRQISAEFASPMNWAAEYSRSQNLPGAGFGVIVEAHDRNGQKASFSNTRGDLSCPGVDIRSAVAFDKNLQPSETAYGVMSGTSMASPYCAGGFALLSLLRPTLRPLDLIECMKQSGKASSSGVPMLKLTAALTACPEN